MRRYLVVFGLLAVVLLPGQALVHAAGGLFTPAAPPRTELLVFERVDCGWCEAFRRDILPRYRLSTGAASAPIRFIDIDHIDLDSLRLKTRLTVLPTAVLMHDGAEVDRIPGYTGPDIFFRLLPVLLDRAH